LAITDLTFWHEVKYFAIFSTVEPGLGIIAGCLITLRPMYRSVRTHFYSYASKSSTEEGKETGESKTAVSKDEKKDEKKDIKYRLSVPFLLSKTNEEDTTAADTTINDTTSFSKDPEKFQGVDTALHSHPVLQKDPMEEEEELPKTLDEKTRKSIRSNRATWFLMPRSSITSVSEQNTLATDKTRGTDDLSWFNLQEPKEDE
jgi:hypothetical protein